MFSKKFFSPKNLIFSLVLLASGVIVITPNFLSDQTKNSQPQVKTTQSKKPSITPQINQQNSPLSDQTNQSQNSNQVQGVTTQQTPVKVTSPQSTSSQNSGTSQSIPPRQTNQAQTEKGRVTLKINTGSNTYSYQVAWLQGMTVYDVMKAVDDKMVGQLYGKPLNSYYITGLEGVNCSCWTYTVNGAEPALGVSLITVSAGDIIIWSKT